MALYWLARVRLIISDSRVLLGVILSLIFLGNTLFHWMGLPSVDPWDGYGCRPKRHNS